MCKHADYGIVGGIGFFAGYFQSPLPAARMLLVDSPFKQNNQQ
jgi:hypothetical protein